MAVYRRLIRDFTVSPDVLSGMTFNDTTKIGLSDTRDSISLKLAEVIPGRLGFPLDVGIRFTTPAVAAGGIVAYEFVQFRTVEPQDPNADPSDVTDVRGRLHDGTTEYHFTAGSWTAVTDAVTDWNTLEEVSANLPSWDPDLALGFVFELSTTDRNLSPAVLGVRVLYQVDIVSFHNDWLYTTLIAAMQDTIRPVADLIDTSDGTTSVALGPVIDQMESGWDVVDVDSVFNETVDPVHRTDILASYDTGTRVITLTGAPTSGDRLLVRFVYAPVVAVTTDHDFTELGSTPAIMFEGADWEDLGEAPGSDNIVNVFSDPPVGVILPAPRRQHLAVTLTVTAPGSVNLRRLAEIVTTFLQERRTIASPTDGREATLRITDTFDSSPLPDQTGLHSATMGFRLENVYVWMRRAIETTGVRQGGLVIITDVGGTTITTPVGGT